MHQVQLVSGVAGHYLHVGVIRISVTNLAIIALMVVVFVAALLAPFPGPEEADPPEDRS
jgi:hypothetical protein